MRKKYFYHNVLFVFKSTQFGMSLLFGELIRRTQKELILFGHAFSRYYIFSRPMPMFWYGLAHPSGSI